MALTPNSPFESYASLSVFPTVGTIYTFYLDRSTQDPANLADANGVPQDGLVYTWIKGTYQFHCNMADTSFVGTRPAHPPHYN